MSEDHLLGELKQAAKTSLRDIQVLYTSNDSRKNEIHSLETRLEKETSARKLDIGQVAHAVERFNEIADELSGEVKSLSQSVGKLTRQVQTLEAIVHNLAQTRFNWAVFFQGLISPKGIFIFTLLGFFITTIFLTLFAPDTLSGFFKALPKK